MLNFTVGPVMMSDEVRKIGGQEIPYFRTTEFSQIMFENECNLKTLFGAKEEDKAIFLTSSGTGAMEASVINCFTKDDKVLIINGGGFGQRFVDICTIHSIPHSEVKLAPGKALHKEDLKPFVGKGYTGFLIQACETSSGVAFDLKLVSDFCKENNLFLVVDAISGFLADEINMSELGIDVMFTGSQKALSTAPGIALIILNQRAINKVKQVHVQSLYFGFESYLKNMERGQTPFTPAVGTLLELNYQLKFFAEKGIAKLNSEIKNRAQYFRTLITDLPLQLFAETPSNCCTALQVSGNNSAHEIFNIIKNEYHMFVCPNGGELKDKVFRVGHIGNLMLDDFKQLSDVLHDMNSRNLL